MSDELPGPSGRLRTTWQVLAKPYASYEAWRPRYGDTFMLPVLNGDVVVSCDPAFIADYLKLTDDEHRPFATEAVAETFAPGTMILAEGRSHKQQRRMVGPFFRGERMRAYADVVGEITRARIARWSGELRMMDEMQPISLDVIVRAVFGADDEAVIERYRAEIGQVMERLSASFFFSVHTHRSLLGLSPWARFSRARRALLDHLIADIEAYRAARAAGGEARADIMAGLVDARDEAGAPLTAEAIAGELGGLLFAGHDTTQIALAWAVYWLLRTPEALGRLREELDSHPADADTRIRLPYLEAVINETLRLYPIVPDNQRVLTVDKTIGGRTYPAGAVVSVAAAMVHMREDLYPEPHVFRPERFLGHRPKPGAFLPFGGGVRRCIGAGLAMFEMKVVLAEVVSAVELELLGDEVPARRNITMAPKHGVRVRVLGPRRANTD